MHSEAERGVRSTVPAEERLSRLPIFTARDYLAANPDVAQAGVDAVRHALVDGAREGRKLFVDTALARAYGRPARSIGLDIPSRVPSEWAKPTETPRCSVFVHSRSDASYREVADGLAADLISLGFDVMVADERVDPLADHGTAIFVAPHDFFRLGLGPLWAEPSVIGKGFIVVDDPVESIEGGQTLRALLDARGVIDLSIVGAGIWREAEIPTHHLPLRVRLRSNWLDPSDLNHPLMMGAPAQAHRLDCDPLAWNDRPLDVLFFGRESPRRNAVLGRLAAALASHRCFIYAQQGVGSKIDERLHRGADWRISGHLSTQARLTLHVSEGRFPALERRRLVQQAMAGGSAVVSTARFTDAQLEPGRHYFHDDAVHIAGLIEWLIVDPDGQRAAERVRERAFDHIATLNRDPLRTTGLRAFLLARHTEKGRTQ